MNPVLEIQRRDGSWFVSETVLPPDKLWEYARALSRWIGDPYGNVLAVRITLRSP